MIFLPFSFFTLFSQYQSTDTLCRQSMEIFYHCYGAEAGLAGLKWLPYGGLYLTGEGKLNEQKWCHVVLICHVLSCLVLSCLVLTWLDLTWLDLTWLDLTWLDLTCLVLSCLVLSCLVLSCLVLSCLVLSCLVLSCLALSWLVLPCLVLPCHLFWFNPGTWCLLYDFIEFYSISICFLVRYYRDTRIHVRALILPFFSIFPDPFPNFSFY